MMQKFNYKISVGSADEYEDYIAEIHFPSIGGMIISQENGPGNFEISFHSFLENQSDDFDYCRKIIEAKLPLEAVQKAMSEAIAELVRLKKRSESV